MLLPPEIASRDAPPDWDGLFGFAGPLELEVGPGHGGFASRYGEAHPGVRLVAVEKRPKFARQTAERVARKGLRNVAVLCAFAEDVAPHLFAHASLAAVHLHFPDPWWKRRHHKRRVVSAAFVGTLRDKLVAGGLVEARTDVEERAFEMLRAFTDAGFANLAGDGAFAEASPDDLPSSREIRYLETGQRVWRLKMRRP